MNSMDEIFDFPTQYPSFGEAMKIFKHGLYDERIPREKRLNAIIRILDMETLNSVTKAELADALRWIFEEFTLES